MIKQLKLKAMHSIECITHAGRAAMSRGAASHSGARRRRTAVSSRLCALFGPVTLTFDLFYLIFIGGRDIVMDYLCAKFGNFNFSRFGFIVRTD